MMALEDGVIGKRTVCVADAQGCGRCHTADRPRPNTPVLLLLGAHNEHASEATQRAVERAHLAFRLHGHQSGRILALPTDRAHLPRLCETLVKHVSPFVQASVQAVLFAGDPDCPIAAITAFVDAEPLPALIARQAHEWVRDALEDNWLFSVFHPIVDAHSLEVIAHEALIRARRPETGEVIGAGPILDACERLRLEHVLDQRARQAAIRGAASLGSLDGLFFINFLPNTIYDPEICLRTTMATAEECGLDPGRLVFEVVESERIPDLQRLRHILAYYRERGVGTAVDDLGAGFASADYLTALQPDYVKLDRSLVVEATEDPAALGRMSDLIKLAHTLGIKVVAEGIETAQQMEVCRALDADFLQGFLFARPAFPPEAVQMIHSQILSPEGDSI